MRSQSGAEAMIWGYGPTVLEIFIEPTCPFSKKAFAKLPSLLDLVGEDALTIKIRFLSQPWHLFSGIVTRAILAATTLDQGKEAGRIVMTAVGDHRDEFDCEDHCRGPNLDKSPRQIVERMTELSGFDLAEAFQKTALEKDIKWHARYCRQMGAHVTPSFAIDGLLTDAMSSGDTVEEWAKELGLARKA